MGCDLMLEIVGNSMDSMVGDEVVASGVSRKVGRVKEEEEDRREWVGADSIFDSVEIGRIRKNGTINSFAKDSAVTGSSSSSLSSNALSSPPLKFPQYSC